MKRNYIVIALSAFLLSASACKKDAIVFPINEDSEELGAIDRTPVKPDYIEVVTEYDGGNIQFVWSEIDTARVKSLEVYFTENGEQESRSVTDFAEPLVFEAMEIDRSYEFTIIAIGLNNEESKPFLIRAIPKPYVYDLIGQTVGINGGNKQIVISWFNTTKQKIAVEATVDGEKYFTETDEASGSLRIPMTSGSYDTEIVITDSLGRSGAPIMSTVQVVEEIQLNTQGWIATANNEYTAGENTGLASALIDGDVNTYWHTDWTEAGTGYPHWVQFDMIAPSIVSKIEMARRQNNGTGMTKFKLEGSLDGINWITVLQPQNFNSNINDLQEYSFTPQEFRYLRMTALEGNANYTHLAEINIFAYK